MACNTSDEEELSTVIFDNIDASVVTDVDGGIHLSSLPGPTDWTTITILQELANQQNL